MTASNHAVGQSTLERRISDMDNGMRPGGGPGIDEATAPPVVAAGANVLVAGPSIFGANEGVGAAIENAAGRDSPRDSELTNFEEERLCSLQW
jgi:hypothetical protein